MLIDLGATFNILDRQLWEFVKENAVKCKCYFINKKIYANVTKEPIKIRGRF